MCTTYSCISETLKAFCEINRCWSACFTTLRDHVTAQILVSIRQQSDFSKTPPLFRLAVGGAGRASTIWSESRRPGLLVGRLQPTGPLQWSELWSNNWCLNNQLVLRLINFFNKMWLTFVENIKWMPSVCIALPSRTPLLNTIKRNKNNMDIL